MTFKELRAGMPVYFLSGKDNEIEVKQGKVIQGAGQSHAPTPQAGQTVNYLAQPVVDVTIELDGQNKSYEMSEALDSTFGGGMMISPNIEIILTEVENRKSQAQERLNRHEQDKAFISRCESIQVLWDPKAKEKKETDDRFKALESSQKEIKTGFDEVKSMMATLLKKLE